MQDGAWRPGVARSVRWSCRGAEVIGQVEEQRCQRLAVAGMERTGDVCNWACSSTANSTSPQPTV